jgi:hypothetical protein
MEYLDWESFVCLESDCAEVVDLLAALLCPGSG